MESPADKMYILFHLSMGRDGKLKAFNRIWKIYSNRITFYITQIIPEEGYTVEDCHQEVMLKIYQGLDTFRAEYSLKPWIYTIARNHSLDYLKRKRADSIDDIDTLPAPGGRNPESEFISSEIFTAFEDSMKKLSDDDSQIAYLRFYEGMKLKEIAAVMNMNINTVKTRITAVKKNLQDDLRGWI